MNNDQIPAARPNSGKTLMNLGHLAVPNTAYPPKSWQAEQVEKRRKAVKTLADATKAWFNIPSLPEQFYLAFAEKAIADLDNL